MSSGAASSAAAEVTVTDDDVRLYLAQTVEIYKDSCRKGFVEHKYDPVVAGLTIGNHIMNER